MINYLKCFIFGAIFLINTSVPKNAVLFQLPCSESSIRQTLLKDNITMLALIGTKGFTYTSKGNIIETLKYASYTTNNYWSVLFKPAKGNLMLGCDHKHIEVFNEAGEPITEYTTENPFIPSENCILIHGKEDNEIYYVFQDNVKQLRVLSKMTYSGVLLVKTFPLNNTTLVLGDSKLFCELMITYDRLICFNQHTNKLWILYIKFEEERASEVFGWGNNVIDTQLINGNGINMIILSITNDQVNGDIMSLSGVNGVWSNLVSKTIMTGMGASDPLQKISAVKLNESLMLYCVSSKQYFYIHKLNIVDLTEYEPRITMNVGGMFIALNTIGVFDINTYSIILTYTDNTNWMMIFPDVIPLCNDNIYLLAEVNYYPNLLLLNNKDNVNLGLKIHFTNEDSLNPTNVPPIVQLNTDMDLTSQIIFTIPGIFTYQYKIGRVSPQFNQYSIECTAIINVCDNNCLTCSLEANKPTCTKCLSGFVLNKNQCKIQCNIDSCYYYDNNNDYQCTSTKYCIDYYSYLLSNTNECLAICPVNKQCTRSCLPCATELILSFITCNCLTQSAFNDEILELGNKIDQYNHYIIISFDNTTYEIFDSQSLNNPTSNRANNISTILPGEIDKLKNQCEIPIEDNIIIYKKDYFTQGNLTNDIEYNFHYSNGTKIDLNKCQDISIEIIIPIINTTSQEYERANNLTNLKINPSNPDDPFFNDICFVFETNNNTDIPRKDRIKNYLQDNSTLCPTKCNFIKIDYTSNKANCSCTHKPIDKTPFDSIKDSFINSLIDGNWSVVKCYNLVFKVTDFLRNIGSWFIICLSTVVIGSMIYFCITSFLPFTNHFSKMIITKEGTQLELQKNQKIIHFNKTHHTLHSAIVIIDKSPENNKKTDKEPKKYTNDEYSNMEFTELLTNDKRNFLQHYWAILRTTHPLINAFCTRNTKTLQSIKISLFIIGLIIDFSMSAFFYSDKYISQNYNGNSNFFSDIPVSIYTFLASLLIGLLLNYLTTSESIITLIDKEAKLNKKALLIKHFFHCYKIKITIYFLIKLVLLVGLWYYTASFCAVYKNSQYDWLISGLKSFGIGLTFPIVIALVLTILLTISIRRTSERVYKVLSFLQSFF